MIEDIENYKDRVEFLLSKYPECRDDDKKLWVAYLNVYHNLSEAMRSASDPWVAFKDVLYDGDTAMPESVRRIRQKFQEAGKYVGEKRKKRLEEAESVRQWAFDNNY